MSKDTLLDRIVIPIVIGALAFTASLLAANISNSGAADTQRELFEEEKRKEDRQRRYDIYLGFAEAVGAYDGPFRAAITCVRSAKEQPQAQICIDRLAEVNEPRQNLRIAYNKVAFYGSDQVYEAATGLFHAIQPFEQIKAEATVAVPAPVPEPPPPSTTVAPPSPAAAPKTFDYGRWGSELVSGYERAFRHFAQVMCAELPAVPRSNC